MSTDNNTTGALPGDLNLEEIIAQRAEARGDDGRHIGFTFGGRRWTHLDPMLLTDDEKDELEELEHDADIAAWYMGEDQYEDFLSTTAIINTKDGRTLQVPGSSSIFFEAFKASQKKAVDELAGKPTRSNRSSRRARRR